MGSEKLSFLQVGKKIIETQGFKSLFTGIPQRCLGVIP